MTDTTKTTIEKAHGCDPVGFQNDSTKDSILAATNAARKTQANLRARTAPAGLTLHAIKNDYEKTVYIVSNEKQFATMQAKFALGGHALNRSTRAEDGRTTFTVSRWGQSRSFTHWNDVLAFATQIGLAQ